MTEKWTRPKRFVRRALALACYGAAFAAGLLALMEPAAAVDDSFETGPGGVVVMVRLTERLSSQDATAGQRFTFETTAPVTVDGVRVPAGTPGEGSVTYARSGRGPEPGKLRLAARVLHLPSGKGLAVGLEPDEARTISASDRAHAAGFAFPTSAGTVVVGGITRGNNVVYERGARFTLLVPPPATPAPEPS